MMNRVLRIALLALCALVFVQPSFSQIGVGISVSFGPPALPVYELPPCPGGGYLWTPGYWAWDPDYGYYWVPGTWVLAPQPGFLWTPGWWGWGGTGFFFHQGYWGPHIGFYGGINYGFGYFGNGFVGGRWLGGVFQYNTAVLNVNRTVIHNTYNETIVNNTTINRVSYNGGQGGITVRPTPEEERYGQEQHVPPVAAQQQHIDAARSNPALRASQNMGKPPIAATSRPNEFSGHGVVQAREAGAPYHPPADVPHAGGNPAPTHASEVQPHQVAPSNSGDAAADENYRRQQQEIVDRQNQEHQQLQQQQEREDQQARQQNYNRDQQQQMEDRHQQQTQQMEDRHQQESQDFMSRQAPRSRPR